MKRVIKQLEYEGDWEGYTLKGERITAAFFDWTGMNICIQDIVDEQGVNEKLAYDIFWKDVREYDTAEFDAIVKSAGTLEDAIGNGLMDELRCDYLNGIFEAEEAQGE